MDGPGASRRTILRTGVLALGALAGAVGLAGLGERIRTGSQPSLDRAIPGAATSFVLRGTDWHLSAPGLRRGDLPKRGDLVSVSGSLSYEGESAEAGSWRERFRDHRRDRKVPWRDWKLHRRAKPARDGR